ncbi:MAG TPA: ArsA family ATPase [Terriglobales bacterium]|nr:ArsA family ATPase [Terriglobales bacterium]
MRRLSFFIGKGGVGKTTVAAAFAVRTARLNPGGHVLLLSTDPAHSLSDILKKPLKDVAATIPLRGRGSLDAWQIDSEKLFAEFLAEHKQNILKILETGSIFSRDDIEPLLDTTLPGMAEVAALLAIHDALSSGKYTHIVVDTAPFGHTLRLFGLPQHFLNFLNFLELAASRDRLLAAHFGGNAKKDGEFVFIEQWRKIVEGVHAALAGSADLFLVTTPETFSLNESLRCANELKTYSPPLQISEIVLNRSVRKAGDCKLCRNRVHSSDGALKFLKRHFPARSVHVGEDVGIPIAGAAVVKKFADHVFGGADFALRLPKRKVRPAPLKRVEWPTLQAPLTFVLGKGGVGKTTISAALGFSTRKKKRHSVQICSVDPAPSLDDIFQKPIGDIPVSVLGDSKFLASEMDSVAIFARWVQDVRANIEEATGAEVSGIHLDLSFERQLLSELLEIVPPGVDEVMAIFRVLDLIANHAQRAGIDMAPTGHALELLRMPDRILAWTRPLLKTLAAHRTLAAARDAAVKVAELGQRVRELATLLKNNAGTHVHVVLLPEVLPDRETERLVSSLRSLQMIPKSIFLNRVIFSKDVGRCERCRRSFQSQQSMMAGLKKKYAGIDIYAVRNFPTEIAGKSALAKFTGELWQLA